MDHRGTLYVKCVPLVQNIQCLLETKDGIALQTRQSIAFMDKLSNILEKYVGLVDEVQQDVLACCESDGSDDITSLDKIELRAAAKILELESNIFILFGMVFFDNPLRSLGSAGSTNLTYGLHQFCAIRFPSHTSGVRIVGEDPVWTDIFASLLSGRTDDVCTALKSLSTKYPTSVVGPVLDSVAQFPPVSNRKTPNEWRLHRERFSKSALHTSSLLAQNTASNVVHFKTLIGVISGSWDALVSLVPRMNSWIQLVAVRLLFLAPVCTPSSQDFKHHVTTAFDTFFEQTNQTAMPGDTVLRDLLCRDLQAVILACRECLPDAWLLANLSFLIKAVLPPGDAESGTTVQACEAISHEFAQTLTADSRYWRIGLAFTTDTALRAKSLIDMAANQSDETIFKEIAFEETTNLALDEHDEEGCRLVDVTRKAILKTKVARLRSEGPDQLNPALAYAILSKDTSSIDRVSLDILKLAAQRMSVLEDAQQIATFELPGDRAIEEAFLEYSGDARATPSAFLRQLFCIRSIFSTRDPQLMAVIADDLFDSDFVVSVSPFTLQLLTKFLFSLKKTKFIDFPVDFVLKFASRHFCHGHSDLNVASGVLSSF